MPLLKAFSDVREFHRTFDQPAPEKPTAQPEARARQRGVWVREECDELDEATALPCPLARTIGQADAYLDIIYFGIGGLVELGVEPSALWDIVHAANMAKRHSVNGELVAVKNEVGKIIKPEGWVAPEPAMQAEVERQVFHASEAEDAGHSRWGSW